MARRERVVTIHLTDEAFELFERCRKKMGGHVDPLDVIAIALGMITDPRLERLAEHFLTDRDGAFDRALKFLKWYAVEKMAGNTPGVFENETGEFLPIVIHEGKVTRIRKVKKSGATNG